MLLQFQFYLSSIKRLSKKGLKNPTKTFQFYLSSIKSKFQNFLNMAYPSFNSTLVQLKGFINKDC